MNRGRTRVGSSSGLWQHGGTRELLPLGALGRGVGRSHGQREPRRVAYPPPSALRLKGPPLAPPSTAAQHAPTPGHTTSCLQGWDRGTSQPRAPDREVESPFLVSTGAPGTWWSLRIRLCACKTRGAGPCRQC
eukprot:scaffold18104_cov114-Isochrysis_galbana.AAC.3